MKDILKYMGLLFIGLFVVVIIYPVLHEVGHSVVAVLVGARVIEFNLLPLPYIVCEVSGLNKLGIVLIGLAGMFIPAMISMMIRSTFFWIWYGALVMRGICLLSFTLSFIAIVLYFFGITITNEDIVQVIHIWNNGVFILIITMVLSMMVIMYSIIKQKPLTKIMVYFKVPIKEENKKLPPY